jgi:hypothetical protein
MSTPPTCPLCRGHITTYKMQFNIAECVVCFKNCVMIDIVPCKHQICFECYNRIVPDNSRLKRIRVRGRECLQSSTYLQLSFVLFFMALLVLSTILLPLIVIIPLSVFIIFLDVTIYIGIKPLERYRQILVVLCILNLYTFAIIPINILKQF